jgi:hypothetical protein
MTFDDPISRRAFLRATACAGAAAALPGLSRGAASDPDADGFRSLFDGKTLQGWHAVPRLSIPKGVDPAKVPPDQLQAETMAWYEKHSTTPAQLARLHHTGRWEVKDGVLIGGQNPPGSGLGAYLVSDETFGDFELELDARPDWPADTGFLIREHALGSIGYQINVDHRPDGAMGGVFGNGLGSFRAAPFSVAADELPGFKIEHLRAGGPEPQFPVPHMNFAATFADFQRVWRLNDWNHFKVRCVGELPLITTWINGQKICELDIATVSTPHFDPALTRRLLGGAGHIGFEVHDNAGMGRARWAPGCVARWRNIRIRTV